MIIVLLLFFKSICLYCQRLVLYVHDRWVNPKNVRLLKEAAEAKGSKFLVDEYRQAKKSKKRRYATTSTATTTNALAESEGCRFCANTPQGYCRHHFHLQELHIQKQQRQQKFWCPLSGVVNRDTNRCKEYRQLRKIKRELKQNIQQHQQLKTAKTSKILHENSSYSSNLTTSQTPSSIPTTLRTNSINSSFGPNDSGYQTNSGSFSAGCISSNLGTEEKNHSHEYIDIDLSSPAASVVETTYSFETCCESTRNTPSSIPKTLSYNSFMSCEYTALSTTYL